MGSSLLRSANVDQTAYVVQNDTVLFSTQIAVTAKDIKQFVLEQPECVAVEWNQVRTPGPAETLEWKAKDAAKKAAQEEKRKKKSGKKRRKSAKKPAVGSEEKSEL